LISLRFFAPPNWRGKGRPKSVKKTHLQERIYFMSQAKTLTPAEIEHMLAFIEQRSFATRNRVMLLTGLWSGMRVGEIASLSVSDVVNTDGTIKAEVRLTAEQTKGRQPRTVFLPQKLRDELAAYMEQRTGAPRNSIYLKRLALLAPVATACDAHSSPR
jgi:integrase